MLGGFLCGYIFKYGDKCKLWSYYELLPSQNFSYLPIKLQIHAFEVMKIFK